jgi:glucokinase
MSNNIFAVDIGGSKLICGVLNTDGEILDTYRVDYLKDYTLQTVIDGIEEGYKNLKQYDCSYCGIAVPGLCDPDNGLWLYSPFSGIENIEICKIVSKITNLKTFCDNDVNISALAEKLFGVCKNSKDFLWVTVSNGIGGGLFLNGELYLGHSLNAGEIGHFIVEEDNPRKCGCGNFGCLEAMASGASIGAIYKERTGVDITAKEIAELARQGDIEALTVWNEAGAYIGKAVAYAINLLGLDTVVLGGGAAMGFDLLEASANKSLDIYLFKRANPNVKLIHSSLGGFAALKGCAALVIEKTKF